MWGGPGGGGGRADRPTADRGMRALIHVLYALLLLMELIRLKSQTRNDAHVSTPERRRYTVKPGFLWMGAAPIHEKPVLTV